MSEETNDYQGNQSASPHPVSYEIRVKDHLDPCWWRWFEGWSLVNLGNGEVTLSRTNADQSALYGALSKIRDLNLTLLSVTRTEEIVDDRMKNEQGS